MGKVVFNMTISIDGFVSGPNDNPENGLGDGGERLFNWYFGGDTEIRPSQGTPTLKVSAQSAALLNAAFKRYGAGIWGRKTFDIAHGWGGHPPGSPAFVLTHAVPTEWVYEGSPFTFVSDGIESAVRQARTVAGDNDVVLCTASVLQQALNAGLVDELHLDVVPVLMGQGVRLFDQLRVTPQDLEIVHVIAAPGVTHLCYRLLRR
ncbi:MAG TPA: dihydrofolate reductase family protein [Anaerolineales bacterium]|nr:dihydrofolate reductase family protein [Anaerolineales bacterium]HRF50254.1 dihydrofolate reductase family protein [Anaerolineales bacterium]